MTIFLITRNLDGLGSPLVRSAKVRVNFRVDQRSKLTLIKQK